MQVRTTIIRHKNQKSWIYRIWGREEKSWQLHNIMELEEEKLLLLEYD